MHTIRVHKTVVWLLIAALMLSASVFTSSAAEAQPQPEAAVQFLNTDDGEILYLRMDAAVRSVADSLSVRLQDPDPDGEETKLFGADAIRVSLPDDAGAVELFILDCWPGSGYVLHITGLLDAVGAPVERDYRLDYDLLQTCVFKGLEIPDEDLSLTINYYTGDISLWKGEGDIKDSERFAPYYCLAGDTVRIPVHVPDALQARTEFIEDGVQTEKIGDDAYKAVAGNGSMTLQIAQHVRYTAKLCVHATRKEQKSMILRTMLRRPWNPCIVWLTGAMLLGSMPFPFLFPVMALLGVATLPIGYLAQFFVMAFRN